MVAAAPSRLELLEARLARIDARGADPGQLEMFGGGTGKPCGESHIAAPLQCHKGGGATSKPPRKAQLEVGREGKSLEQFGREFHLRLTGGDQPERDVWGKVSASVSNVLLRDPDYATIWSTKIHKRAADMGEAVGVKPIVETDDFYKVPKIRAFDLTFEVGTIKGRPSLNRMEISAADGALVARNVFRQMAEMLKGLPDGTLLTANAWTQDGYGDQRAKMYQALGFEFPEDNPGHDGIALIKGGKVAKPIRADSEDDREEEAFVAAALQLPEFGGSKPAGRIDAVLDRLDALQGRLDDQGEACGQSFIAREKTCRKGLGRQLEKFGDDQAGQLERPHSDPIRRMEGEMETFTPKVGHRGSLIEVDNPSPEGPRKLFAKAWAAPSKLDGTTAAWLESEGLPEPPEEDTSNRVGDYRERRIYELFFKTGTTPQNPSFDRLELSPAAGRRLAIATFAELKSIVADLPEGALLRAVPHRDDGYGAEREAAFEAMGFRFEGPAGAGFAYAMDGKITPLEAVTGRARRDGTDGHSDERVLELLLRLPEFGGGRAPGRMDALIFRLDALEERLDARKSDPGQMDLFGGGPGKPCGEGHIAAPLKCHKGTGSPATPPAATPAAAPRRPAAGPLLRALERQTKPEERLLPDGPRRVSGDTETGFDHYLNREVRVAHSREEADALRKELDQAGGWKAGRWKGGGPDGSKWAYTRETPLPKGRGILYDQIGHDKGKTYLIQTTKLTTKTMPYLRKDVEKVGELQDKTHRQEVYRVKGTDRYVVRSIRKARGGEPYITEVEGREELEALWKRRQQPTREWTGIGSGERQVTVKGMEVSEPLRLDALLLRLDTLEFRIDARRQAAAPGQMDLFSGAGGGPGTGKPCGEGHIAAPLTCHKGEGAGAPPAAAPAAAPAANGPVRPLSERCIMSPVAAFNPHGYQRWTDAFADRPGPEGEHVRQMQKFIDDAGLVITIQDPNVLGSAGAVKREADRLRRPDATQLLNGMQARAEADQESIALDDDVMGRRANLNMAERLKRFNDQGGDQLQTESASRDVLALLIMRDSSLGNSHTGRPLICLNGTPTAQGRLLSVAQLQQETRPDDKMVSDVTQAVGARLFGTANRSTLTGRPSINEARRQEARQDAFRELRDSGYFGDTGLRTLRKVNRELDMSFGVASSIPSDTSAHFGEAMAVLFHEVGHQVHRMAEHPSPPNLHRESRYLTRYAQVSDKELFAEAFSAYTLAPTAFQRSHPELYGWVDKAFQQAQQNAQINREVGR